MVAKPATRPTARAIEDARRRARSTSPTPARAPRGKEHDLDDYARVLGEALEAGRSVAPACAWCIQFGSESVRDYARARGYLESSRARRRGDRPGCGA
jgi:hypothetical protein